MFRMLLISFLMVFVVSLAVPVDYASGDSRRMARESRTPTRRFHLQTPTITNSPETFDFHPQEQQNQQFHQTQPFRR